MNWVVTAGLTRRLIDAPTEEQAIEEFVAEFPRRQLMAVDDVIVRPARDDELAEFAPRTKKPPRIEAQLELELDDTRYERGKGRKRAGRKHEGRG